jgi:hypothetical protein
MRVTSCPDCGEVVEIPEASDPGDEVTCPTCGLSGPVEEWRSYAPEDDNSLLGRPLADATIPATVPRSWAIRIEQLEEIKDVVVELQHQIRLLRQALDELNDDLPDRVKRWVASLQPQSPPAVLADSASAVCEPSTPLPVASEGVTTKQQAGRRSRLARNQSALW